MAGLGEATAIIAVAQLGFSLAKTLNVFIGDYKDARQTLTRMGAEIESTSLAMERLGNLAQKGKLYGNRGILEAAGLANRYSDAIADIRAMLKKKNKTVDQTAVKIDEIELTSFQRFQFAFLKPKLEISQLEVSRIKADLTLTYLSMIALTGDTEAEKKQAASEIPAWTKTLKWANHEFEKAVSRQKNSAVHSLPGLQPDPPSYAISTYDTISRRPPARQSSLNQDDVSAEHLKQYIQWAEKEQAEAQRKAEQVRLEVLRQEQEKKLAEEKAKEALIAEKAIKEYEEKREKQAAELKLMERIKEDDFRQRLQDARVPEEEIERILNKAPLMLAAPERPGNINASFSNGNGIPAGQMIVKPESPPAQSHSRPQPPYDARTPGHRLSGAPSIPPKPKTRQQPKRATPRPVLEAWCIDQTSQLRFCTPLNEDWLDDFIAGKAYKKSSRRMWERYAQLHVWYRKQINEIFEEKMHDRKHKWSMISLDQTRASKSMFSLRRSANDSLVQLILIQLPHQAGPNYRLWIDDRDELPPLPSAPQPNPQGPNGEGSEAFSGVEDMSETENEAQGVNMTINNRYNRDDPAPLLIPAQQSPDVVIEVFKTDNGESTILPTAVIDGTRLHEHGYHYIDAGANYIVTARMTEDVLDLLIDESYQVIGVVNYGSEFQTLSDAERVKARGQIKRNFPDVDAVPGLSRFRVISIERFMEDGRPVINPGQLSAADPSARATPFDIPGQDARTAEMILRHAGPSGPETRSALLKKTRFADDENRIHPYVSRPRSDVSSVDSFGISRPREVIIRRERPPGSTRISERRELERRYSPAPHRRSLAPPVRSSYYDDDNYYKTEIDEYRPSHLRPPRRETYYPETSVIPRNDYTYPSAVRNQPSEYETELRLERARSATPARPTPIHDHESLPGPRREVDEPWRSATHRRRSEYIPPPRQPSLDLYVNDVAGPAKSPYSHERTSYTVERYGHPPLNVPARNLNRSSSYRDDYTADHDHSVPRQGSFLSMRQPRDHERVRPPAHHYRDRDRDRYPSRRSTLDSHIPSPPTSPDSSDAEYETYGSTSRYRPMRDHTDAETHDDKDVTAMQLAKYTGGINLNLQPTTTPLNHSSAPAPIGHPTVEDTIDESNFPIQDRITEIHEEPEETTAIRPHITAVSWNPQETWSWGFRGANAGTGGGDTAADAEPEKNNKEQTNVTAAAGDDDWTQSWGLSSKKKGKKKGKKAKDSEEAAAADDGVPDGSWDANPNPPVSGNHEDGNTNGNGNGTANWNANGNGNGSGNWDWNRARTTTGTGDDGRERRNGGGGDGGRGRDDDTDADRWSWNTSGNKKDFDDWDRRKKRGGGGGGDR